MTPYHSYYYYHILFEFFFFSLQKYQRMKDFAKKNNFPIKERKGISFTMHGGKVKKYLTYVHSLPIIWTLLFECSGRRRSRFWPSREKVEVKKARRG